MKVELIIDTFDQEEVIPDLFRLHNVECVPDDTAGNVYHVNERDKHNIENILEEASIEYQWAEPTEEESAHYDIETDDD